MPRRTRRAERGSSRPRRLAAAAACLLALAWVQARAQEPVVRASIDRSRIQLGDRLTLTIEIEGGSSDRASPPDLSRIEDFDIVQGPSVSSRFQWINGRSTASKSFRYALRPRRIGRLRIPPIGLLVAGRTYSTRALAVEVVHGGTRGGPVPAPAPVPRGPGPDRRSVEGGAGAEGDVRVRAQVDAREVYVGQQVTLSILMDIQPDLLGVSMQDSPSFPGFWTEEIRLPDNYDARRVQVGGVPTVRYTLMKRALFPTRPGQLTIPGVTYQIQIRRRSSDPVQSFFFSPIDTLTRSTQPVTIQVKPLPEEKKPPDFTGAVGDFALSVLADRTESLVNDAIGLKVRVAGEGNLNAVTGPSLPDLPEFKQYAPKVTSASNVRRDRLRGEKVWDYVLIPMAPGEQTIPPVRFSFFDPRAGEYRTVWSGPIAIQVARGEGEGGSPYGAVAQKDVRRLRDDIHYIKLAPAGLQDRSRPFYRSSWFVALLLTPVAADLGILAFALRRERSRSDTRTRRERRARRSARRRLKEARRSMNPGSSRAFYASVALALTEYVADKFDTSAAGLTHQQIEELLAGRGVPDHLRRTYHRCLEACDYARFAPASADPSHMTRAIKSAEETIVALERALAA